MRTSSPRWSVLPPSPNRGCGGFTLVELMIVVAIIGVLATISIPNFQRFALRSKAGEAKLNLTAIRSAEGAYFGEYGTYVRASVEPSGRSAAGTIGSSKRPWRPCPALITLNDSTGFCVMGFAPEGPTYFDYEVATLNSNVGRTVATMDVEYFAAANSDIDGDRNPNQWGVMIPDGSGNATPPALVALTCPAVLDDTGAPGLLGSPGPCGPGMGHSIF